MKDHHRIVIEAFRETLGQPPPETFPAIVTYTWDLNQVSEPLTVTLDENSGTISLATLSVPTLPCRFSPETQTYRLGMQTLVIQGYAPDIGAYRVEILPS